MDWVVMPRNVLRYFVELAIVDIVSPGVVVVHDVGNCLELVEEPVLLRHIILEAFLAFLHISV